MTLALQLASLEPGTELEMFELDATALGGAVHRFYNHTNALSGNLVWQGNVYQAWPIAASGFATRSTGALPRPTLRVGNLGGLVGVLVRQFNGLRGARLLRRRTLAQYLDAVNFAGGVNPSADPSAHLPDELWLVDRQAERNRAVVVFELVCPLDVAGTELPRRPMLAGHCWWLSDGGYRGANCGYTGAAVAKADDSATAVMGEDKCGGRLSSCKLRQWPDGKLRFGGFPGLGVLRNV